MNHKSLIVDKHVEFIQKLNDKQDQLEYWLSEHLRLSGVYWGLTALDLMGRIDALPRSEIIDYVMECRQENGGFGGHKEYDAHLLYTLSAVQILVTLEAKEQLALIRDGVLTYIKSLQNPDGSFMGDEWGEVDSRFSLCAVMTAKLLDGIEVAVDKRKCVDWIESCQNFDGGFGSCPGSESHAGQIFCCVGVLNILDRMDVLGDGETLGKWLADRQLKCGGLNGRPEKLQDVCYSWWVLSSLEMLGKRHWISGDRLTEFILQCQDTEQGGIADREGDEPDVFHTLFGIAGLSLLGYPGLEKVDACFCMRKDRVEKSF